MKKIGLICLAGLVCSGIFFEEPVYAAEKTEIVEEMPSNPEENPMEPEISLDKPQNLVMNFKKEGVKPGDILNLEISAEKAEYYEIYIYNSLTNEKVFYLQTTEPGTYQWTAEEGEFSLYFLAGNQNGISESERQSLKVEPLKGQWEKYGKQWKYLQADGTYVSGTMMKIDGTYYSFDAKGNMETGWKYIDSNWYYFASWGGMQIDWNYINGAWYYMNAEGVMQTGWQVINGEKYFFRPSGAMELGWYHDGMNWYYLRSSGAMAKGWEAVGSTWYYMNNEGVMQTGWQYIDGSWYLLASWGGMQTGWAMVNGHWYYMNGSGVMQTGWQYVSGYKHLFAENGEMYTDLRGIVPGPYHIRVNRSQNCVTVYAEEGANRFAIPVISFLCSTGGSKTPVGTFVMSTQYRWHQLYGAAGQYCSRITGHVLFHSVPFRKMGDIYSLMAGQFNRLGSNASAGCVRLSTGDAKWIYDNCNTGSTYINIYDGGSSSPLGRPVLPKIPYYQNWDPTDPAITG